MGTEGTCHGWAGVAGGADLVESGELQRLRRRLRQTRTDDEDVGVRAVASAARARTATLWPSVRRLRRPQRPRTMIRNRRMLVVRTA